MEKVLTSCGISWNPKTKQIAEALVSLNKAVDKLDLISCSENDLPYLAIYKKLSGNKNTKVIEFYKIMIEQDIDCLPTLLGNPVSPTQALHDFVMKKIDFDKIPKIQKDMVDTSKKIFTDPITLQQQSFDQIVQLKESGELLSKDTLKDLFVRNTSIWCGKQNVGFFTPITNTMLGNPVSYNFDMSDFFPQPPSVLSIVRIKNTSKIPSSKKPLIVPEFYFRFHYLNNLVFYLPDTADGRKIFFLFKDAFKKGNLFAVDKTGYIRHGRIHKKTSLGTGTHAFPDDTYLERVYGELRSIGSTLFTYRHSDDKAFNLYADPYPKEKRFQLKFNEKK